MDARPAIGFHVLGRFVVRVDGAEVPPTSFGGRKVRLLLRILLTRRGEMLSPDALADLLWDAAAPRDPRANLQVLVNRARRALDRPGVLVTAAGGYGLAGGTVCTVDAEEFLARVEGLRGATGWAAIEGYDAALAAWRGDPLPEDSYAAWAAPYRERLLRARQEALESAAAAACDLATPAAVDLAARAVHHEPLRESANLLLVRALDTVGDVAGALARYADYRTRLADELGVDPSPEAEELQVALLRRGVDRPTGPEVVIPRTPTRVSELGFVGRRRELSALLEAHRAQGVAWVEGRSGAGKSRLLAQVQSSTHAVSVRAYRAEQETPWSLLRSLVAELLTLDTQAAEVLPAAQRDALGQLLPDLVAPGSQTFEGETLRALVLEAGLGLLGQHTVPACYVDDVQWLDASTAALLRLLPQRLPGLPLVLACRSEEQTAKARSLRHDLDPATTLALGPLSPDDLAGLVADDDLRTALLETTDRTPLAVLEVLRELDVRGAVRRVRGGRFVLRAPAGRSLAREVAARGQQQAIAARLDRTAGTAREVVCLLGVLRRDVPAPLVADALGVELDLVLVALDELAAAELVRLGETGWGTAHDMVADVLEESLTGTERHRFDTLAARALDAVEPAAAAAHWERAGEVGRAADGYLLAAEESVRAFANQEAVELADRGLRLSPPPATSARLHVLRGRAAIRAGDLTGGRRDLRRALASYPPGPQHAQVLAELALAASGSDDAVRASELAEMSLVEAGEDTVARATALEVAAMLDMNLGRDVRSRERIREAIDLNQRAGRPDGLARVYDVRAMATFVGGDIRAGTAQLHRAADLFEEYGDLIRMITPLSTRGHGLVFLAEPEAALADTTAALDLARTLGHRDGQAYAGWHTTEALAALGRGEEALAVATEALATARTIGHRGWTATAFRALGIAQLALDRPDEALASFTSSLAEASHLDLFASWAAARIASVRVVLGDLGPAQEMVDRALATGPGLGHFEGRLAQVEVAVALSSPDAVALARQAAEKAQRGGCLVHLPRLREIAGS